MSHWSAHGRRRCLLLLCLFAIIAGGTSLFCAFGSSSYYARELRFTKPILLLDHQRGDNFYCPWCNDPILCARKFLFVVATGRSGSTTVMGMLNGIPGVFLSGENDGEVTRLRELHELRAARRRAMAAASNGTRDHHDATTASQQQEDLMAIQRWIWEANLPPAFIDPSPAIVGFKEIRWTPADIAFIQQVCPCSRFVINARRDARKQAESSFYQASATPLQDVERANQRLVATKRAIMPPERLFTLDLEDFSVANFNRLASDWLGISCRFRALIHSNADGSIRPGKQARCRSVT
jgi:hypothetical protein